jgi:hypothetical protein
MKLLVILLLAITKQEALDQWDRDTDSLRGKRVTIADEATESPKYERKRRRHERTLGQWRLFFLLRTE